LVGRVDRYSFQNSFGEKYFSGAFPLVFFELVGLCGCATMNQYAFCVLKRAIDQRAITFNAIEGAAVDLAIVLVDGLYMVLIGY
jgi:hypothetical protein